MLKFFVHKYYKYLIIMEHTHDYQSESVVVLYMLVACSTDFQYSRIYRSSQIQL